MVAVPFILFILKIGKEFRIERSEFERFMSKAKTK